ncbi:Hypothetical predicted protein [Mytilus galloprovincialis]|uniref:C2H2-type domain-containing protein n=1 Tax=Mytilus galloprovincialis TaxID=29158 RepID=A0A8B6FMP2_MYTGA|nr:Hypothetical predicted protein [Mytilus galloprovincialis]
MEPASKKMKMSVYKCDTCGKSFSQKQGLSRHKRTAHSKEKLECRLCSISFNRRDNYLRHMKRHEFQQIGGGRTEANTDKENESEPCNFKALNGTVETHIFEAKGLNKFDPMTFLKSQYDDVKEIIKFKIKERGGIKWYLSMKVKMSRRKGDDVETAEPHFRGKCQTSLKLEDIEAGLKESIKKMYTSFIEYQRQGSNWTVDKVVESYHTYGTVQTLKRLKLYSTSN